MFRSRYYLTLIGLIIAGYLGNYFSWSLFFGVDFLFGSTFVLIAVYYYGIFWGTLAALVSSSYTYLLWHHPYAIIILTVEALFIALCLRYIRTNMVLLDGIYWLIIGMPLVFISYYFFLKMTILAVWVVMLKQAVNGIFNALIANLIINYSFLYKFIGRQQVKPRLSFQQTIFNLLVTFVFFPALIVTVIDGQQNFNNIQTQIYSDLQSTGLPIADTINLWYEQHLKGMETISKNITVTSKVSVNNIQANLTNIKHLFPSFTKLYIIDTQGKILAAEPQVNEKEENIIGRNMDSNLNLEHIKGTLQPEITEVHLDQASLIPHVGIKVPLVVNNRLSGFVYGSLNLPELQDFIKVNTQIQGLQTILIDQKNQIIADSYGQSNTLKKFDFEPEGSINRVKGELYHWLPTNPGFSAMKRWSKSFYFQKIKINQNLPWVLMVKINPSPYINNLYLLYIKNLSFMLLITWVGLGCAIIISRRLVTSVLKLAQATTDLPSKIMEENEAERLPTSQIIEVDLLSSNFKQMSRILKQQFQEIQQAKHNLEEKVEERTKELLILNENLAQEIKQREEIEEILRESQERYELAVSGTNDGIWDWNLRTNEVYYSPVFTKILGYQDANFPHTFATWHERVHPDDLAKALEELQNHLDGKTKLYENIHRLQHRDGNYIWIEAKGRCIRDQNHQPYRLVGTITNISEKKQAEEKLTAAKEAAEVANMAKSEFLANMSHEIRTPMNAILGFCDLLQGLITEPRPRSYLNIITASGKTLLALINDILDLSRIEAGKLKISYDPINVRMLIEEICQIFSQQAAQKNLHLYMKIEDDVPKIIIFDEVRLRQILLNVVGNAIKFTKQGYVKIKVRSEENKTGNQNEIDSDRVIKLEIAIKDTGIGISPDQQEKIFDVFTQSEGQNNRKYGGTGLGLTITKRLTEMLGGTIKVESELGQGSIFTFTFSGIIVSDNQELANYETSINLGLNQFKPSKILVVDDIQSNCDLIEGYFQDTPHRLFWANDGQAAINQVQIHHPDLILMDLRMPNMDGREAAEFLKQNEDTRSIPIVILTASCDNEEQKELEEICQGFIRKPVSSHQLVEVLERILPKIPLSCSLILPNIPNTQPITTLEDLTPHISIDALKQLLKKLNQEEDTQEWSQLSQTLKMRDLKKFAQRLQQLSQEYYYPPLLTYTSKLITQIEEFDGENLPKTLKHFPELRKALEDLIINQ